MTCLNNDVHKQPRTGLGSAIQVHKRDVRLRQETSYRQNSIQLVCRRFRGCAAIASWFNECTEEFQFMMQKALRETTRKRASNIIHVVRFERRRRRRGRNRVQLSPPRLEESEKFSGTWTSVRVSIPATAEDVSVSPVRGPSNVVDSGRQSTAGRAMAAQRRRRVGSIVISDDGEDDGVPVATGVRRRQTA